MQLNSIERLFITSPVRSFVQKHLEARQLLQLGGPTQGARVLEVGCGPGYGIDLIYDCFGACRVDAFDLDTRMASRVRERFAKPKRKPAVWVGNVRHIPVIDDEHRPACVISVRDVVAFLVDAFPREVLNLPAGDMALHRREGA